MVTFIKKLFYFKGFFDPLLNIISSWFRQNWLDILIIAIFASATAIATYHGSQQINPLILGEGGGMCGSMQIYHVFLKT